MANRMCFVVFEDLHVVGRMANEKISVSSLSSTYLSLSLYPSPSLRPSLPLSPLPYSRLPHFLSKAPCIFIHVCPLFFSLSRSSLSLFISQPCAILFLVCMQYLYILMCTLSVCSLLCVRAIQRRYFIVSVPLAPAKAR